MIPLEKPDYMGKPKVVEVRSVTHATILETIAAAACCGLHADRLLLASLSARE
jgi:hypothetical protein